MKHKNGISHIVRLSPPTEQLVPGNAGEAIEKLLITVNIYFIKMDVPPISSTIAFFYSTGLLENDFTRVFWAGIPSGWIDSGGKLLPF